MRSLKKLCNKINISSELQHEKLSAKITSELSELSSEEQETLSKNWNVCTCLSAMLDDCNSINSNNNDNNSNNESKGNTVYTLSRKKIESILQKIEDEIESVSNCENISAEQQVFLLTKYVTVFRECTKRTVVARIHWNKCFNIVKNMFRQEEEHNVVEQEVERQRHVLLEQLRQWSSICWWSTHFGLDVELSAMTENNERLIKEDNNDYNNSQNTKNNDNNNDNKQDNSSSVSETEYVNESCSTANTNEELIKCEMEISEEGVKNQKRKDSLACFVEEHYTFLHKYNQLCHSYKHLFDVYGMIGTMERNALYTLLTSFCESVSENTKQNNKESDISNNNNNSSYNIVKESVESNGAHVSNLDCTYSSNASELVNAIESVIRQTFRRDLAVPSLHLCNEILLEEYNEFEVDDKKRKEMLKIFENTQRKAEYTQIVDLYNIINDYAEEVIKTESQEEEQQQHEKPELKEETDESKTVENKKRELTATNKLFNIHADLLVQTYMKRAVYSAYYTALSFTFYRILEVEAEQSASVNLSRIEFICTTMHKWLSMYIAREHRWSVLDTFSDVNDNDLWHFLLQRHSMLVSLGVLSAQQTRQEPYLENGKEESSIFERIYNAQIDVIRTVTSSLLHCWHLYAMLTVSSRSNNVKKRARLENALHLLHTWVQSELIAVFGQSLLNDINSDYDNKQSSSSNNSNDTFGSDSDNVSGSRVTQEEERTKRNAEDEHWVYSECNSFNYTRTSTDSGKEKVIDMRHDEENDDCLFFALESVLLEGKLKLIICDTQLSVESFALSENFSQQQQEYEQQSSLSSLSCFNISIMCEVCDRLNKIIDASLSSIEEYYEYYHIQQEDQQRHEEELSKMKQQQVNEKSLEEEYQEEEKVKDHNTAYVKKEVLINNKSQSVHNIHICECLQQLVIRLLQRLEKVYEIVKCAFVKIHHNIAHQEFVNKKWNSNEEKELESLQTHILDLLLMYEKKFIKLFTLVSKLTFPHVCNSDINNNNNNAFVIELAYDGWHRCIAWQVSKITTQSPSTSLTHKGNNTSNLKRTSFIDAVIERRKAMKQIMNISRQNDKFNIVDSDVTVTQHSSKKRRRVDDSENEEHELQES